MISAFDRDYIATPGDQVGPTVGEREIARIINVLRRAFIKNANGAEAVKFEAAVYAVYPFATNWISPNEG